ncbi:hypothetical protein LTR66_003595 [Elasticomyces elasticus]|nr:hypothetical protein LTR66_003595 [Elasticomyces elasticus]
MDVVGLIAATLAISQFAVQTGLAVQRFARAYPTTYRQIFDATRRLEIQRYTLDLWQSISEEQAENANIDEQGAQNATIDANYVRIWGKEDYLRVRACLTQLEKYLQEAARILESIDSTGFKNTSPLLTQSSAPLTTTKRRFDSGVHSIEPRLARWFTGYTSPPRRRKSTRKSDTTKAKKPKQDQDSEDALRARLGASKKLKWCTGVREELRQAIAQVDRGLAQLQSVAKLSQKKQRMLRDRRENAEPQTALITVQAAAEALHTSLVNIPSQLTYRMELGMARDRTLPDSCQRLLSRYDILTPTEESFKFPLLISEITEPGMDNRTGPLLLVAEVFDARLSARKKARLGIDRAHILSERSSFENVMERFRSSQRPRELPPRTDPYVPYQPHVYQQTPYLAPGIPEHPLQYGPYGYDHMQPRLVLPPPPSLLLLSQDATVVIHSAALAPHLALTPRVLPDIVRAQPAHSLLTFQRRLKVACTVAMSVLHLHSSRWVPAALSSSDVCSYDPSGLAEDGLDDTRLFISKPQDHNARPAATPFDCLCQQTSQELITDRARVALMFHRLGIVLFELGRGKQYNEIFERPRHGRGRGHGMGGPDAERVHREINKICFGRPYRDLVRICLSGSLYADTVDEVTREFNTLVVERLRSLERHMSAIIQGDL